jgi:hypothetical protein
MIEFCEKIDEIVQLCAQKHPVVVAQTFLSVRFDAGFTGTNVCATNERKRKVLKLPNKTFVPQREIHKRVHRFSVGIHS